MSDERRRFSDALDVLGVIYDRIVSVETKRIYWQDLGYFGIERLEAALLKHRLDPDRGRFFPKPADIMCALQAEDLGHPASDVAWAIAISLYDQSASAAVTNEIMAASAVAEPIYSEGDKIGARMAFRSAYEAAVGKAMAEGRRAFWWITLGHDPAGRTAAVDEAIVKNRISADRAGAFLPPPEACAIPAPRETNAFEPASRYDDACRWKKIGDLIRGAGGVTSRDIT